MPSIAVLNPDTGVLEKKTCKVDEIKKNSEGESLLVVGNYLDLKDVISVRN